MNSIQGPKQLCFRLQQYIIVDWNSSEKDCKDQFNNNKARSWAAGVIAGIGNGLMVHWLTVSTTRYWKIEALTALFFRNRRAFIMACSRRFEGNDILCCRNSAQNVGRKTAWNGEYVLDYLYKFCGKCRICAVDLGKFWNGWKIYERYMGYVIQNWISKLRYTRCNLGIAQMYSSKSASGFQLGQNRSSKTRDKSVLYGEHGNNVGLPCIQCRL